jgi:hypothetical protein
VSSTEFIDQAVQRIARRHDGLVPVGSLHASGVSDATINRRRASGLLVPVSSGVCALPATVLTPVRRALAVALVTPDAWISHRSAAAAVGLAIPRELVVAEITTPSVRRVRVPAVHGHRSHEALHERDRQWFAGAVVSRPAVVMVELAAVLAIAAVELVLDDALQKRRVTTSSVRAALDRRAPHGRGVAGLRGLLDDRDHGLGIVRSWLEQQTRSILRFSGLPEPVRNYEVTGLRGRRRIIDLAWPRLRLGIEADSWEHHSNPGDWGQTRVRDRELRAAGWTIVPCVVADTRQPEDFLEAVRVEAERLVTALSRGH